MNARAPSLQFSLVKLLLSVLVISLALAVFRLPTPLAIGLMMLAGSIVFACLGKSYGETVLLGLYGSMAGVWIAEVGGCLVAWSIRIDWMRALVASWMCLPLGVCVGMVVAHCQHQRRLYVAISEDLERLRAAGASRQESADLTRKA